MDDAYRMQEKNFDELCEDIVNISRVLPNLTPLDLQTELLELRNDPDRVTTILKRHFKFYNEERENQMSQDIKMIKRVLPNTPIVQISKDLADVGSKKNRVQLVLKKYFTATEMVNTSCKRSSENTDSLANKILKLDDCVTSTECTSDHLLPPNSPISKVDSGEQHLNSNVLFNMNELLSNASTSIMEDTTIVGEEENAKEPVEETSRDSGEFSNTLANEIVHSISNILSSSESNEETQLESDGEKSLLEVVNSFYPGLSSLEVEVMLSHLGINIHENVDDATVNVVLNEIMNYFENKETLQRVNTRDGNTNTNTLVKTDTQSTETSSTEEYDVKEELSQFFSNAGVVVEPCVLVKQETPYQIESTNYTDKNLGLLSKICREIEDDSNNILKNKVFGEKKCISGIASGTDNWVKSALIQKEQPSTSSTSSTSTTLESNIVKSENSRKRSVCSTVTSASASASASANVVEPFIKDEPLTPQVKQENVMNYIDFCLDLSSHHTQDVNVNGPKRCKRTDNWAFASNNEPVEKTANRNIVERPPRDNLKSSLNSNFGAYSKNFVQYLENRNNIISNNAYEENPNVQYLRNEFNFENRYIPNPYLANDTNSNNINNNNLEDMSRKSSNSLLTKREENKVKAWLCELDNGKCNTCKKCLKNRVALKVRNDLFRRNGEMETPAVVDPLDPVNASDTNPQSPIIVDVSDSSSSNSNPLPGTSTSLDPNEKHPFFYKIMEMFPDICPEFLRNLCAGKDHSSKTLDCLISTLLEGTYDRRERQMSPAPALDFDEQYKTLLDLFPDADPTYLQQHCERLFEHPNEFKEFVASLLEHKNYPSREEYLKKMKLSAQQKQYTTEFDVKKYLEVIPNPEEYFKNRTVKRNFVDEDYALTFLKNHYCHITIKDISIIFRDCEHSIVRASVILDKMEKNMKSKRRLYPLMNCLNIPLLQEIAYVKNKNEILKYMKKQEKERQENRERAKDAGLLKTCECCYDDEVMPEEMACCENNHVFCKECVKKGCEVKIGEGKLDFPCLTTCDGLFSLQVLQNVLTPKVFSKMAQRKQLEEVKSAGIEDLEFCPFCDFATIPAPGDKLFRCLNADCMKESCRECKEPSHIPLRCDELEKENDVKLRTYIEDKMTEALVRKCYKCGMKFIKEEGCNKMTCSCGAMMCYVCNQPVKDYKHFNGQGGDQYHLCPLYSDTHKLHMDAVKLSAENAKKELGIVNNQLKIDPTANLDQHYKRLANRNPQNLPPGMEQLNPQHIHIRIQEFHLARR